MEQLGLKYDDEKLRYDLLPWECIEDIVKILNFGAKKYAPNNWQKVPDPKNRYFAALIRHIVAWFKGEKIDPESGLPHLAHAGCCILFLMWFDKEKKNEIDISHCIGNAIRGMQLSGSESEEKISNIERSTNSS